jgi:hypothetical protein
MFVDKRLDEADGVVWAEYGLAGETAEVLELGM